MECEEDAAEDEREKVEAGTFQASRTYSTLNVVDGACGLEDFWIEETIEKEIGEERCAWCEWDFFGFESWDYKGWMMVKSGY